MTNEQEKIRFFGANIGARIKCRDDIYGGGYPVYNEDERRWKLQLLDNRQSIKDTIFDSEDFSDCQIIGRRTSQMTSGEYEKYNKIWEKNSHTLSDFYDLIAYLNSIGVFPDKYFEPMPDGTIWCVEEK